MRFSSVSLADMHLNVYQLLVIHSLNVNVIAAVGLEEQVSQALIYILLSSRFRPCVHSQKNPAPLGTTGRQRSERQIPPFLEVCATEETKCFSRVCSAVASHISWTFALCCSQSSRAQGAALMKGLHVDSPSRKLSLTRPPRRSRGGILGCYLRFGSGSGSSDMEVRQHSNVKGPAWSSVKNVPISPRRTLCLVKTTC